jgi:hypothetical protein
MQIEALAKLRRGGEQTVRVEHVHVYPVCRGDITDDCLASGVATISLNAEIKSRHCGKAVTRIGEDWSVVAQRPGRNRYPGSPGRLGRGVAYADGRVFRGLVDGHVLALDAKTGDVIWDVVGADTDAGEFYTAAPVVWDGRVYLGNAGSDYGGIGHIRAFDAKTGNRLWNFDTVPSTGDAAKTWPDDPKRVKAGGGTYSSYALDTEAGLLYSPVGNPGPGFVRDYRKGDNLYTSSVVVLDARTGELKGYHQLVKNDFHDWDVAASPILFTSKAGRKMVAAAGKNGYLYGLSRDLKDVFYQTPATRIENVDAPLTPEGTRFLPGTQGGTNWYGPSYSPSLNALFVSTIDWQRRSSSPTRKAWSTTHPSRLSDLPTGSATKTRRTSGSATSAPLMPIAAKCSGNMTPTPRWWHQSRRPQAACFSLATRRGISSPSTRPADACC